MTTERRRSAPPPARIIAAATLSAVLALPMLAAAGSLAAHATSGDGLASAVSAILAIAVLGIAAVNLYGAFLLAQRGAPRYAQLGSYLTIALTAAVLAGLVGNESLGVAAAISVVFLGPTIAILTLLGSRPARRWFAIRNQPVRAQRRTA